MGKGAPAQPQQQGGQQQRSPPLLSSSLHPAPKLKLRPQFVGAEQSLVLVPGVLSVQECQRVIDAAEALRFEHQGSRGPAFGEAYRDNHRISMQDQGIADALWEVCGLGRVMQGIQWDGLQPVGLNHNIRVYRYGPGQRFGKHVDDSVQVAPGQYTGYTLLVYLSGLPQQQQQQQGPIDVTAPPASKSSAQAGGGQAGSRSKRQKQGPSGQQQQQQQGAANTSALQDVVGGETVFYGHRGRLVASVRPQAGLALLHLHGDRCLEHEGNEVLQGVKYVLRSDVVFAA